MVPWINNPSSGSIPLTSAKPEPETRTQSRTSEASDFLGARRKAPRRRFCPVAGLAALCSLLLLACVALSVLYTNESDSRPEWSRLLLDYQNVSDGYLAAAAANGRLKRDNALLRGRSSRLRERTELLNGTSADLASANLALSLRSAELAERIGNLTSENARLVRSASERRGEELSASRAARRMADSAARRVEEAERVAQVNGLLRDELLQVKEANRRLLEVNDGFRGEVKELSDDCGRRTELQEQNLSSVLTTEREEAAEREEQRREEMERKMEDIEALEEAFRSLDLYCPVVHPQTKERVCRTCPDSWRLFEKKCYFFSSRRLTWSSSRAWCRTQGGDLLVVNSAAEQSFVLESSRLQPSSRLWIGLTDAEEEGAWRWVDGSAVTSDVQYWLSRPGLGAEPDNWRLHDLRGEDCGHVDASEEALKSWMDGSCETAYRWICEQNV